MRVSMCSLSGGVETGGWHLVSFLLSLTEPGARLAASESRGPPYTASAGDQAGFLLVQQALSADPLSRP